MKSTRRASLAAALLWGFAAVGNAQTSAASRFDDPAWAKDAADGLARCAGTYRGAAEVLRADGRRDRANYLDGVASGALFASYVLLTSPAALEGRVLGTVDTHVYIEALARGSETNFSALSDAAQSAGAMAQALRSCTQTSGLQSSVLQTLKTAATPAAGTVLDAPLASDPPVRN